MESDLSNFFVREHVHAENRIDVRIFQSTDLYQLLCATRQGVLAVLEDQLDGARELLCLQSSFAVPSSIATCMSCPQACIMPGSSLLYGSPVSSVTGSASISTMSS